MRESGNSSISLFQLKHTRTRKVAAEKVVRWTVFVLLCFHLHELILFHLPLLHILVTFEKSANNLYFRRIKNSFHYVVKLDFRLLSKDFFLLPVSSAIHSCIYLMNIFFRLFNPNLVINFGRFQSLPRISKLKASKDFITLEFAMPVI